MDYPKCPKCGAETRFYREMSMIDHAAGYVDDGEFLVVEWKDTGNYEVIEEYWQCDNGHNVDIEMELSE